MEDDTYNWETTNLNWMNAQKWCKEKAEATLASFNDEETRNFLANYQDYDASYGTFIGGQAVGGKFSWDNGAKPSKWVGEKYPVSEQSKWVGEKYPVSEQSKWVGKKYPVSEPSNWVSELF